MHGNSGDKGVITFPLTQNLQSKISKSGYKLVLPILVSASKHSGEVSGTGYWNSENLITLSHEYD